MPSNGFLIASLIWSTVGVACIVWGRKTGEFAPAIAGIALIAISWFIQSAGIMSLSAIGILVAMNYMKRRGI